MKKLFGKKILKILFQLQVNISSAHPVQTKSFRILHKCGFPPFVTPEDFFQKSGSVTFVPLWCNVYYGPRASNLSQQLRKKIWSKLIFEQQNQKKFMGKKLLSEKIWKKKFGKYLFEKNLKKLFGKKILKILFSTSSKYIKSSAHPVQTSSLSEYCITVIMWYLTKKSKKKTKND